MLYKDVYAQLKNEIRSGKYPIGSRLPSVQTLCEEYSVSAITIRRALDILRKEGYVTRQPRIGTTVVATDLNQKSYSHESKPTVAFITTEFADSFGTPLLRGVLHEARNKASIMLSITDGNNMIEEEAIASAIAAKVDGLMLLPSDSDFIPQSVLNLVSKKFPVTIIDRVFQGVPVATVSSNNSVGASEATKYLMSLGHRNIAFISSDSHASSITFRRRGWELAHASNSVTLDENLCLSNLRSTLPNARKNEEENDINKLVHFFSKNPQITACVVAEYNLALIVWEALLRLKKTIPTDISIVCFDHIGYHFDGQLFRFTHIEQQQYQLGAAAINLTLKQIDDGSSTDQILLPTHLVVGQSTQKIQ